MNAKEIEAIVKAVVKSSKATKSVKPKTISKSVDGLNWWSKKFGFKATQTGLKHKCSNGKIYPAVKGLDSNGKEITLVATRGGNVYKKPF